MNIPISQVTEASLENYIEEHGSLYLDEETQKEISSGTHIYIDVPLNRASRGTRDSLGPKWVYIPFNIPFVPLDFSHTGDNEQMRNVIKELEELYKNNHDKITLCEQLARLLENYGTKNVVDIYKQLFGGIHNSQSMAVFSGIIIQDKRYMDIENRNNLYHGSSECRNRHNCQHFTRWEREDKMPCNFLYMGDYEAQKYKNFSALKLFYSSHKVWDTICGVQIPHHGSQDNYCVDLYEDKCFAVASYGVQNSYNHPSIDILLRIDQAGCTPNLVNENIETLKYQYFKIF